MGKREGNSFVQVEVCESVGLASGESIMLELLPKADGVKVIDPAEVMRRCEDVFIGVEVLVVLALERD